MTRAYGVPVARDEIQSTDALQRRRTRGRPNWWVILAVSLALIALLVETSGRGDVGRAIRVQSVASTRAPQTAQSEAPQRSGVLPTSSTTTTTSTSEPPAAVSVADQGPAPNARTKGNTVVPQVSAMTTTTTTRPAPTTTTTTGAPSSLAAARSQTEGYFDPPLNTSGAYAITGSGPTEVSVLWSAAVYLTMTVSCPSGSQTVGGTTAMELSLPDVSGGCQATVSEPSSESSSLTYTVTIGPAGG
jgi:hypothetical protein